MASDQADSIDLDTIIVNLDIMQRRHAFCPFHGLAAFSTLFVAEAARNIGLQKEFVRFSVVLPAGRVDDKIDNILKENLRKLSNVSFHLKPVNYEADEMNETL